MGLTGDGSQMNVLERFGRICPAELKMTFCNGERCTAQKGEGFAPNQGLFPAWKQLPDLLRSLFHGDCYLFALILTFLDLI